MTEESLITWMVGTGAMVTISIATGVWALSGRFEKIREKISENNAASEARAVLTHTHIQQECRDLRQSFVGVQTHEALVARVEALDDRINRHIDNH